jgi:excisionase family DNA binding protein
MTEEFLRPREVAESLKVSTQTIKVWINTGRLKAVKVGHQWRIRQADLDEFLKKGEARHDRG